MYTSKTWNDFCDSMNRLHAEQERLRRRLKACIQCKVRDARYDSLYCSEACKKAFYAELRGEN